MVLLESWYNTEPSTVGVVHIYFKKSLNEFLLMTPTTSMLACSYSFGYFIILYFQMGIAKKYVSV